TIGAVATGTRQGNDALLITAAVPPDNGLIHTGAPLQIGPKRRFALDLARDNGTPRLIEPGKGAYPGPPAVSMFFPLYGPGEAPATTEDRRARIQGFLVGVARPGITASQELSLATMRRTALTVSDGSFVFFRSLGAKGRPRDVV